MMEKFFKDLVELAGKHGFQIEIPEEDGKDIESVLFIIQEKRMIIDPHLESTNN